MVSVYFKFVINITQLQIIMQKMVVVQSSINQVLFNFLPLRAQDGIHKGTASDVSVLVVLLLYIVS